MNAPLRLTACSLCLRVLDEGRWMDAEYAIRKRRTYDLPSAVRLDPGLCDGCAAMIEHRRSPTRHHERLAA
jgi:hypothetical protein